MQSLQDFTIFLHGPSGAGKGELQRKLTQQYLDRGYQVNAISSGDLYREAFAKPEIAEIMKRGGFFDTLAAIMPGLQERYSQFIQDWKVSEGKTVILLDGLVRRGVFTNKEGTQIPSQIEQIAQGFYEVRQQLQIAPVDQGQMENEIVNSNHLLVDIHPQDAETQMRGRANKELSGVHTQLDFLVTEAGLPFEASAQMYLLLEGISEVVNADITTEAEFNELSAEVQILRQQIASLLKVEGDGSIAKFFEQFGITTQLRDDDVSPLARRKRLENYVITEGDLFKPGFATIALIDGLGYRFSPDGSFSSTKENSKVIKNGQSKGIELATFQAECESLGRKIADESDEARVEMSLGVEGQRRGKEN